MSLSYRDAMRALAATETGDLLGDEHDLDDLFDAGVLTTRRDMTDEYLTYLTPEGSQAIREALKRADSEVNG